MGGARLVLYEPPFFSGRALTFLASLFLTNKSIIPTFCAGCFSTSNNRDRLMSAPLLMDMLSQEFAILHSIRTLSS